MRDRAPRRCTARLLVAAAATAVALFAWHVETVAACTTQTIVLGGTVTVCTTCCTAGSCTTICN